MILDIKIYLIYCNIKHYKNYTLMKLGYSLAKVQKK